MNSKRFKSYKEHLDRGKHCSDPLAFFFWATQVKPFPTFDRRQLDVTLNSALQKAQERGLDCFALHDSASIMQAAKAIGLPDFDMPIDGPIHLQPSVWLSGDWRAYFNNPKEPIVAPSTPRLTVPTHLQPSAWSLAGWMSYCGQEEGFRRSMMTAAFKSKPLPGFLNPETMPITEVVIQPGRLTEPLSQWIPAFKDTQGKIHDLLDLSVATLDDMGFTHASDSLSRYSTAADQAKAGYLGRQAARIFDIGKFYIDSVNRLHNASIPLSEDYDDVDKRIDKLIVLALLAGASVPHESWSGPSAQARPSHSGSAARQVMVQYLEASVGATDAQMAKTLERLHQEGHDVVVLHIDDAEENQKKRPYSLPLHTWVLKEYKETVAVLLRAGADPMARLYDPRHKRGNAIDVANLLREGVEELQSLLRAAQARQVAHQSLRDLGLKMSSFKR